ncbi:hypothetical protein FB451DRAFT_1404871 [Mycena latifolia]|nr:hypothetical protein FB451DRAFT_1404871 [Mycena latifolia]
MQLSFWTFIKGQLFASPAVVTADLTGKTVIVLGANTGIGFESAKHFARMNAGRLILAYRSQSKGEAAVDKLKAATGYERAELWLIDLADFTSVRHFADKFESDGGRLDALTARLPSSPPIVASAVCPGYCYSELRPEFSGVQAVVHFFMERLLAFSAEQGSRQLVFGAVALPHRPEDLRGAEEGKRVQNRVWDEMVEILGKVDPRVTDTVEKCLSPPA